MLHLGFTAFVLTSLAPLGLALVYGHPHSSLKGSTAKGEVSQKLSSVRTKKLAEWAVKSTRTLLGRTTHALPGLPKSIHTGCDYRPMEVGIRHIKLTFNPLVALALVPLIRANRTLNRLSKSALLSLPTV